MLRAISASVGSRFGKFHSPVTELMILILALAVSLPGVKLLDTYKENWGKASEVERNLVDSYRSYTKNLDEEIYVYLLNVPDRLFA